MCCRKYTNVYKLTCVTLTLNGVLSHELRSDRTYLGHLYFYCILPSLQVFMRFSGESDLALKKPKIKGAGGGDVKTTHQPRT